MEDNKLTLKLEQHSVSLRRNKRQDIFLQKRQVDLSGMDGPSFSTDIFKAPDQVYCKSNPDLDASIRKELEAIQDSEFAVSDFPHFVSLIRTGGIVQKHLGVTAVRKIISIKGAPLHLISEHGLTPVFLEGLQQDEYPRLKIESGWALANIAMGEGELMRQVVAEGKGIAILLEQLAKSSHCVELGEQIMWCLGNMAIGDNAHKDAIIQMDGLSTMTAFLQKDLALLCSQGSEAEDKVVNRYQNSVWATSNFLRVKPFLPHPSMKPALTTFLDVLLAVDFNCDLTCNDGTWAVLAVVTHYAEASQERVTRVTDDEQQSPPDEFALLLQLLSTHQSALLQVVHNLGRDHQPLQMSSLKLLLLVLCPDHDKKDIVAPLLNNFLQKGLLQSLAANLMHFSAKIQGFTLDTLYNIAQQGRVFAKQILMKKNVLSSCLDILRDPSSKSQVKVKVLELLIGVLKAVKTVTATSALLQKGFYEQTMDLVKSIESVKPKEGSRLLVLVLLLLKQSIKIEQASHESQVLCYLRNNGHTGTLEQLLFHQNASVAAKAKGLLEKYLPAEMENEAIEEY